MMTKTYFPREEYESRWRRVHDEMARLGFDSAVVWGRTASSFDRAGDLLYLSNYASTKVGQGFDAGPHNARAYAAVILQSGETPALHSDDPDLRRDLIPTDRLQWHADPVEGVARALAARGIAGRVAFVGSDFFPMKYWRQLQTATPDIEWVEADDLVRRVRLRKSPRELECCREAGAIASRAMTLLMESLVAGRSEAEAAASAAAEIVRCGGVVNRIACNHGDTIAYSCRDPMAGYSLDAPQPGDMIRAFVVGPMFQGYFMDPGRSAVAGAAPSPAQRDVIESCARIVEEIAAAIRPGVPFRQAGALGDRLVADFAPDGDAAMQKFPFYGHLQGLYFESPPYISTVFDPGEAVFEESMVIGVEAFLARAGVGNAGFEDNYIVGPDGLELITTSPTLWW